MHASRSAAGSRSANQAVAVMSAWATTKAAAMPNARRARAAIWTSSGARVGASPRTPSRTRAVKARVSASVRTWNVVRTVAGRGASVAAHSACTRPPRTLAAMSAAAASHCGLPWWVMADPAIASVPITSTTWIAKPPGSIPHQSHDSAEAGRLTRGQPPWTHNAAQLQPALL